MTTHKPIDAAAADLHAHVMFPYVANAIDRLSAELTPQLDALCTAWVTKTGQTTDPRTVACALERAVTRVLGTAVGVVIRAMDTVVEPEGHLDAATIEAAAEKIARSIRRHADRQILTTLERLGLW